MAVSEGTYVTAHRHTAGAHVIVVGGEGYEMFFFNGEKERRKVQANPYTVVAPKLNEYHQHFNSGKGEYRMLAFRGPELRFGWGKRYNPNSATQSKGRNAAQHKIPHAQEDPEIREEYYRALEKNGVSLRLEPLDQDSG